VADSPFARCKHIKLSVKASSQPWQKRKDESELEVREVQDYCTQWQKHTRKGCVNYKDFLSSAYATWMTFGLLQPLDRQILSRKQDLKHRHWLCKQLQWFKKLLTHKHFLQPLFWGCLLP